MITKEQFEREKQYWASVAVLKAMLAQQLISDQEYLTIVTNLQAKYRPYSGSLAG